MGILEEVQGLLKQVRDLQGMNEQLRNEKAALENELKRRSSSEERERVLEAFKRENARLANNNLQLSSEYDSLRRANTVAQSKYDALLASCSQIAERRDALLRDNGELRVSNDRIRRRTDDVEKANTMLAESRRAWQMRAVNAQQKSKDLEFLVSKLQEETADLRSAVQVREASLKRAAQTYKDLDRRFEALSRENMRLYAVQPLGGVNAVDTSGLDVEASEAKGATVRGVDPAREGADVSVPWEPSHVQKARLEALKRANEAWTVYSQPAGIDLAASEARRCGDGTRCEHEPVKRGDDALAELAKIAAQCAFYPKENVTGYIALGLSGEVAELAEVTLGLCTETGQLSELIKKGWRSGEKPNRERVIEEAGDVMFYWLRLLDELGIGFNSVLWAAGKKYLRKRAEWEATKKQ